MPQGGELTGTTPGEGTTAPATHALNAAPRLQSSPASLVGNPSLSGLSAAEGCWLESLPN